MAQRDPGRWNARLWLGLAGMLLAGCQSSPPLPPLSPIAVAETYGYADMALTDDRYVVTYTGPIRLTYNYPVTRERDVEAARAVILDFAVWRAAQIAAGQGFQGFHVDDRRSDIETYLQPGDLGSPFNDPLYPGLWHYRPFGYPYFPDFIPSAYLKGRAIIDVTLLKVPGRGDYDAADAIAGFRLAYPGADGTPPAPQASARDAAIQQDGRLAQ